jgi:hypothetical protein
VRAYSFTSNFIQHTVMRAGSRSRQMLTTKWRLVGTWLVFKTGCRSHAIWLYAGRFAGRAVAEGPLAWIGVLPEPLGRTDWVAVALTKTWDMMEILA